LCDKKLVPGGQRECGPISQEEVARLEALEAWWRGDQVAYDRAMPALDDTHPNGSVLEGQPTTCLSGATHTGTQKSWTLGNVTRGTFLNAVVKIMTVVHASFGSRKYEIYVTDGTVNPMPTRNFHGMDARIPPSALFCLAVFNTVQPSSEALFKEGNFVCFPNVNVKEYQGALELSWSELVSDKQAADGWKDKVCYLVDPTDPRATEIEQ
jgi:hypothetical protein